MCLHQGGFEASIECASKMVRMFDRDFSGSINFMEFQELQFVYGVTNPSWCFCLFMLLISFCLFVELVFGCFFPFNFVIHQQVLDANALRF